MLQRSLFLWVAALLLKAAPSPAQVNRIEADGVRIVELPHEHPRLYLRARDILDLRRRMIHPGTKPVWEELQAMARASRQIRLEVDALRYLLDGDRELGRRTVADALSLRRTSGAGLQDENNSRKIGRMMVTASIVYDWCYSAFTTEQKAGFIAGLVRLASGSWMERSNSGRSLRENSYSLSKVTSCRSLAFSSAPTGAGWPRAAMTIQRSSGTCSRERGAGKSLLVDSLQVA